MTAALATTVPAPSPVRLRPAPKSDPPYEDPPHRRPADEAARRIGPYDIELPLDWGRVRRSGGRATGRPRSGRTGQRAVSRPGPAGWRAMADDLPQAIRRFVDMYVEVLNARRPLRHLLPYASEEAFSSIRAGLSTRGGSWWPAGRRTPRRRRPAATPAARRMPIRVQRLRFCAPRPGVVEVTAVLRQAEEVRAVAVRLEQEHRQWICTVLEFVD